jgi:hypothetical protein
MRWWVVIGLVAAVLGGRAAADPLPAKNQALLLLRILAYDHNIASRVDNKKVTILVVSKTDSDSAAADMTSVLKEIGKSTKLSGNAIQVSRVTFDDKTFDLSKVKAAAIYVAPGLGDNIATITSGSQKNKILSFTGSPELVTSGVSVGFGNDSGKPVIWVNIPAAKREGADLDVALLRVAKIVKK